MANPTAIRLMMIKQNHQCYYCDRQMFSNGFRHSLMPTVEHLVRQADGGCDSKHNMVMACRECNSHRGEYDPETWRRVCQQVIHFRQVRKRVVNSINNNVWYTGRRAGVPKQTLKNIQKSIKKVGSRVLTIAETVQVRIAA